MFATPLAIIGLIFSLIKITMLLAEWAKEHPELKGGVNELIEALNEAHIEANISMASQDRAKEVQGP